MTHRTLGAMLAALVVVACLDGCAHAPAGDSPAVVSPPASVVIASDDDAGTATRCARGWTLAEVASTDFSKDPMSDERKARVRSALLAADATRESAARWGAMLGEQCDAIIGVILKEKVAGSDVDRCEQAIELIAQARASAGGELRASLAPPTCFASMQAGADCGAACDPRVSRDRIAVACERGQLVGICTGQCKGVCDLAEPADCPGTCAGGCVSGFRGACAGTCRGRCDGRDAHGHCPGTCEGSCDAVGHGTCAGPCAGRCELDTNGVCAGTCVGSCDRPLGELQCTGDVKAANVPGPCTLGCRVWLQSGVRCLPGFAEVRLEGARNASVATLLLRSVGPHLEPVSRIPIGMKPRLRESIRHLRGLVTAAEADGALSPCLRHALSEGLRAASRLEGVLNVADRLMSVMVGG